MSLQPYRRKRDFSQTPEPSGDEAPGARSASAARGGPAAPDGHGSSTARSASAVAEPSLATGRFVVQRHRARNLHFDLRLEIDGVLVSWAVPKGPTLDPDVRHAAFHVEDHPLDYFDFEGVIPAHQYGAGDVIVWDWGTFRSESPEPPGRSVASGELKFELFGRKLRGRFTIIRTDGRGGRRKGGAESRTETSSEHSGSEQWLLIKKRDDAAVNGWDPNGLGLSVRTGRTNDEVAAGLEPPFDSLLETAEPAEGDVRHAHCDRVFEIAGARAGPMPDFIEPMKATLSQRAFTDPAWLYELKWDGYRVQARVQEGRARFATRRGLDATSYFPGLAGPPDWTTADQAIFDGEVVALDAAGEPSFRLLQAWRGSAQRPAPGRGVTPKASASPDEPALPDQAAALAYVVFDLLYLDGQSLLDVPLETRKRLLRTVLCESPTVRYASHLDDGEALYAAVAQRDLEGIVAKRRSSRYTPGQRSPAWLKVKRRTEQEFVVVGWTPRAGSETELGALALGVYRDGRLRPAGRVGTGFDAAERSRLVELLTPLASSRPSVRPGPDDRAMRWVEPRVVVRVEYAEWPEDSLLRSASYLGLDPDADPAAVTRETAREGAGEATHSVEARGTPVPGGEVADPEPAPSTAKSARGSGHATASAAPLAPAAATFEPATPEELAALDALPSGGGQWEVAGRRLNLRNLDKLIWPADGIVKRDLIHYYAWVAPFALLYLRDRALTVFRHPDGIERPGFWQKQIPGHAPGWVSCWTWPTGLGGGGRDYVVADSTATLAWLAHEAAIDLHPSTFRVDAPQHPTWALIDIDPGPRTGWDEVLVLARLYRTALEHLGVRGFPKVTGQRGIQIWIPIKPIYAFEQTRDWVLALSRAIAATVPELVSWEWGKDRREGLARLDYTQNAPNKTLVGPYAVRPVAGAPVSVPISWSELDDPSLRPNGWTIRTLPARLAEVGDLFEPAATIEQELPPL